MPKEANYNLHNIKELKSNISYLNKKINILTKNVKQISTNISVLSNTMSSMSNPSTPMSTNEHFFNEENKITISEKIKKLILNDKKIYINFKFKHNTNYIVQLLCLTDTNLIIKTEQLYQTNGNSYNLIAFIPIYFDETLLGYVNKNKNVSNIINRSLNKRSINSSNNININIDIDTNVYRL